MAAFAVKEVRPVFFSVPSRILGSGPFPGELSFLRDTGRESVGGHCGLHVGHTVSERCAPASPGWTGHARELSPSGSWRLETGRREEFFRPSR